MSDKFSIVSFTLDQAAVSNALSQRFWDISIVGNPNSDERSVVARDFAVTQSTSSYFLQEENNTFFIDKEKVTPNRLSILLQDAKNILIEATSLAIPEILAALRAAVKQNIRSISFLYLEPLEYRRNLKGNLTEHRDFDLSKNSRFRSVHGFMTNLTDTPPGQAVFFLGYEKSRLGQALEQEEMLRQWRKYAVFGVPGYETGWEIDALANNSSHLASSRFEVRYVAASGVNSAYRLLQDLKKDDKTGKPMVICPLGTKPHALGAALFLTEHNEGQETTLLFDHPSKSSQRSSKVKRWHVYDITW